MATTKSGNWTIAFDDRARRELRNLDTPIQNANLRYFRERIATPRDPRRFGKALTREFSGLWRYRIADCRAICEIRDNQVTVLVLPIGHRREIYR